MPTLGAGAYLVLTPSTQISTVVASQIIDIQ
jgi:hypothetical protein